MIDETLKKSLDQINLSAMKFNESIAGVVDSLAEPLVKYLGITHFGGIKIFKDGTMLRLANNKEWTQRYFEKAFYNDVDLYGMRNVPINDSRSIILTGTPVGEHFISICQDYKMWNFLLIYERFEDHGNFWFFGTDPDNVEILHYYMNNLQIFRRFTTYFKEKLSYIFSEYDSHKLITTKNKFLNYDQTHDIKIQKFINDTKIKSYHLKDNVYLSQREAECLFFLAQGKTMKEVARTTNLSPRTVEFYINNIKKKTGHHTKSQIIRTFTDESPFLLDAWVSSFDDPTKKGTL